MQRRYYLLLNVVIFILFSGIFIYCYFLSSEPFHLKCIHRQLLGTACPSCGLSRSFSAVLHFNWQEADIFNPLGKRLFLFFLLQFLMRIMIIGWLSNAVRKYDVLIKVDGVVAVLSYIIFFYPFIAGSFYLFYKMLITGNAGG